MVTRPTLNRKTLGPNPSWAALEQLEPLWYTMTMKRFWDKVQKTDGCWNWKAGIRSLKTGYGCFKYKGKVIDTHRFVWFLTYGEIPKGKLIYHTCDNRLCVNPTHLFLGSYRDNLLDAIKKKRFIPFKNSPYTQKGRISDHRKITFKKAEKIRNEFLEGNIDYRGLKRKYNLGLQTIFNILHYKTYLK